MTAALLLGCCLQVGGPPAAPADDWNLGLLGATGQPLPEGKGIRVASLHPGGPAAQSGLRPGDEIVALAGRPFGKRDDPIYALVDAIEAVTTGKSPLLPLTVMRGGAPTQLKVPLPALGKHSAACPKGCERCGRMVAESLVWLGKQQRADGAFASSLGGQNGHVAVTALAGLALLATGSTPTEGPHADALRKAVEYVVARGGVEDAMGLGKGASGANWNQVNWSCGYAGLFLGIVHRRAPTPTIEAKLGALAQAIAANQEASGGWAHGPGGPNALGYLELEIMSNYCLAALGLARQAGVEVPQETIDRALAFVDASSNGGAVGYSPRAGQKGLGDPGRTAGAVVAFQALDLERHPKYQPMLKFASRGFGELYKGHVSPVMHFLSGGMAAHGAGSDTFAEFQAAFRREFLAARRPDGAFAARPTEESKKLHSNTDRQIGMAWTTASYLILQQLPGGHLKW